jgi:WD40 repeat protein
MRNAVVRVLLLAMIAIPVLPCPAQTALPVQWLYSPLYEVMSVAYSPDGTLLAASGTSGVQIFQTSTGKLLRCFPTSSEVFAFAVAFSPNGKFIAVGGEGVDSTTNQIVGEVELWEVSSGSLLTSFGTSAVIVRCVGFSPDGATLVDGGLDQTGGLLECWNISSKALTASLPTSASSVGSVAFSADGKTLVSGGTIATGTYPFQYTGVLELWSTSTLSRVASLPTAATQVFSVSISPSGGTLADGGISNSGGVLELWNVASHQMVANLNTKATFVGALSFSPGGNALACGGSNSSGGVLESWNPTTAKLVTSFPTSASTIRAACYSPNGSSLADGGDGLQNRGVLELWNTSTQTLEISPNTSAYQNSLVEFVLSPDNVTMASATTGGADQSGNVLYPPQLDMWSLATGDLVRSLPTTVPEYMGAMCFSPNGSLLADVGNSFDQATYTGTGIVELWNVASGSLVRTLKTSVNSSYPAPTLGFSPDGKMLGVCGTSQIPGSTGYSPVLEIWNVASGGLITSLILNLNNNAWEANCVAFSPNGTLVADGESDYDGSTNTNFGAIRFWNVGTWTQSGEIKSTSNNVTAMAFSPDGALIADCSSDPYQVIPTVIEEWDVATGKLLGTWAYPANTNPTSLAFSADGSFLFVGTQGLGLQVFSAKDLSLITTYAGWPTPYQSANSVSISGRGDLIGYFNAYDWLVVSNNPYFTYPISSLTISPTSVPGGNTSTGTVTLAGPAGSGGTVVSLSSSNAAAAVPATVTVAAGKTTGTFTVKTTPVPSLTSVTINANLNGTTESASLSIKAPTLASLTLNPTTVAGIASSVGTLTLSSPAPTGGVTIDLSSSSLAASLPSSVSIPAGQLSATFTVTTVAVTTQTSVAITGTLAGSSQSATLTLVPIALASISLNPSTVAGGNLSTGTASLNGLAPKGGVVVKLTSSLSGVTVPASVTILAGSSSATFAVKTSAVGIQKVATITGKLGTVSQSATLTVNPPVLLSVNVNPSSVTGSGSSTGTVTLSGPAPSGGLVVKLSSSLSSVTTPVSMTVATGKSTATFTAKTTPVGTQTRATITASLNGAAETATLTVNPPALASLTLSPTTVTGGKTSTGTVKISAAAPTGGFVVTLASSESGATVPATVKIPAGKTSITFVVKTAKVSSKSTATISANAGGATKTAVLTIS